MTQQAIRPPQQATEEALPIVSIDSHIGPRLVEDLRPYCEQSLLSDFDDFAKQVERLREEARAQMPGSDLALRHHNSRTKGHYDHSARLSDLDYDGVAAEVIFHGSQNDEPVPFSHVIIADLMDTGHDAEHVAAGRRIYNRWLADFCAQAPDRRAGLAHLPMWDVEAAVKELEWAANAGLRGVNFPAPSAQMKPYNDPSWEPFFAAAEDLRMPLTTHTGGAGIAGQCTGPEASALMVIEAGWFSRRAIHQFVFGGVFERHPGLRLVMTEQPGDWWEGAMRELDSVWQVQGPAVHEKVPRLPSEYCAEQVFLGGSFLAHFEVLAAIKHNYVDNVMWGSDYPHVEGTWQYPLPDDDESVGVQSLRTTFAGIDETTIRKMVGETAARVYGFDLDTLRQIAASINAPSSELLAQAPESVSPRATSTAFRTFGPWA